MATQEPVIAEPDIHGGILLDESCRFLLLMSAGLYKSIEEATGTDQVNKYIAQCVVEQASSNNLTNFTFYFIFLQFREQATLTGVAQAVVDRAVRLHHDWYMSNSVNNTCSTKREDITLVLRNFNFPLPNAIKSPSVASSLSVIPTSLSETNNALKTLTTNDVVARGDTNTSTIRTDTSSSSRYVRTESDGGVGEDQRIQAYVDFSEYYLTVEIARKNGTLPGGIDF